ncbi:unnamed protein product [Cercopithifilaria johnstoni]|uniref:Uncharacterized protein n=1 Tax=Cercopithifilaria johnstoni TaxID=2874296 RepID=A0A8J2M633_9BILA|nr:unnamed protein product [Cercopithifilaria johnstoni]
MENIILRKQHYQPTMFHSFVLLFILFIAKTSEAVPEIQTYRMQNKLLEETQFSNPKSFDYNFEDDLKKYADKNDVYDELVPHLPSFTLHKNGKYAGRTSVPIITRKMPSWSTPSPRQKFVEPYKPFSIKLWNNAQQSLQKPTAALFTKSPISQRLTTTRARIPKTRTTTARTTTRARSSTTRFRTFLQQQQQQRHQQKQKQQRRLQKQREHNTRQSS